MLIFNGALRSELETLMQGAQEEWASVEYCAGSYDALDVAQFALDGVCQNRAELDRLVREHGHRLVETCALAML
jgi:hypothetical protein